jgi:hypothetical protein
MKSILLWGGLIAAAMIVCAGAACADGAFVKEATGDFGKITVAENGCVIINNVWDRSTAPAGYEQSVFLDEHGLPGWKWNAPGTRDTVLGMPEIVCGDKPWDAPLKLRPEFPFRAGERRLSASFDVDFKASGRHNMAFSLWAVSKLPAVKQNIALEIMIWNVDGGVIYVANKVDTIESGGTTFDVWVKNDEGVITGPDPFTWKLVMFVARKPFLKGAIDFGPFVDYLIARRMLSPNDWLTNLELGTEVADGAGRVEVHSLELHTVDSKN